jgi:enoyl-CoA hydratase/carnithine racemase
MPYDGYECLQVEVDGGIATVSIDNPPINLLDLSLLTEIDRLGSELAEDGEVRVAVFQSADPEFFIAHADVGLIQQLPAEVGPRPTELGFFHRSMERFRQMPKVTIGKIEGRARGGGSEFLLALDLRFGAIGRCILGQPEVALGIIPGGTGTQRLPGLMGRGRALEVVLGCEDFDAELAERYGWINRALPPREIGPFVDRLARRIASFPAEAIALAKQAVDAARQPGIQGLLEEQHCFDRSRVTEAARQRMEAFLAAGGQTRELELELASLMSRDGA